MYVCMYIYVCINIYVYMAKLRPEKAKMRPKMATMRAKIAKMRLTAARPLFLLRHLGGILLWALVDVGDFGQRLWHTQAMLYVCTYLYKHLFFKKKREMTKRKPKMAKMKHKRAKMRPKIRLKRKPKMPLGADTSCI